MENVVAKLDKKIEQTAKEKGKIRIKADQEEHAIIKTLAKSLEDQKYHLYEKQDKLLAEKNELLHRLQELRDPQPQLQLPSNQKMLAKHNLKVVAGPKTKLATAGRRGASTGPAQRNKTLVASGRRRHLSKQPRMGGIPLS